MQSVLVVVAQASLHKCFHCQQALDGFLGLHYCDACGKPQPVSGLDYFQAFDVPRHFEQNAAELEKKFYQVSRLLHPDRFTGAGLESKMISLERMSWVNQAYKTLRSSSALRDYLLKQEQVEVKAVIPAELAETWFDLQDWLSDGPEKDERSIRVSAFLQQLIDAGQEAEKQMALLEKQYDTLPSRDVLEKIARLAQERSYVQSLMNTVRGAL